jgi:hypothetical protein
LIARPSLASDPSGAALGDVEEAAPHASVIRNPDCLDNEEIRSFLLREEIIVPSDLDEFVKFGKGIFAAGTPDCRYEVLERGVHDSLCRNFKPATGGIWDRDG